MKYLLIILTLLCAITVSAQTERSKKELRQEKKQKQMEDISEMIKNKNFVFFPTNAMPLSGSSVQLTSDFSAKLSGDSITSYLPFYGVAYYAEYGNTKSPFSFEELIDNYEIEKDKKGYQLRFSVKQKNDKLDFVFSISDMGYASLSINSVNRQSISYHGRIERPEEE